MDKHPPLTRWVWGGILTATALFPLWARADTPSSAQPLTLAQVYLGGVTAQMSDLASPLATDAFRAGGGGFYAHETYILTHQSGHCPNSEASIPLAQTIKTFAGSAPVMAEFGILPPLAIEQVITCRYQHLGLFPQVGLTNITVGHTSLADWTAFVDASRSVGVRFLGPVVSPNTPADPQDWTNPYWNTVKKMALYGGVLAMDTPPLLYKMLGDGYTRFAQQQLMWARRHGVLSVVIISPANKETTFAADAQAWVEKIATVPGSEPSALVVENYNAGTTPDIGVEQQPETLAHAALVLTHYLTTAPP